VALPIWIALAAACLWFAPAAAYLWILPLLSAGLLLSMTPPGNDALVRIASLLVLCVSGTLWLREAGDLSRFMVAVMGRLPIVTPFFVYAAVLSAAGLMVVPPLVAVVATERPVPKPWAITALILLAWAATLPAYTREQPLRRFVRALQEAHSPAATWEVASVEPGLDLAPDAPGEWTLTGGEPAQASIPWGRYSFPFVFRAPGPSLGPPPASIGSFEVKPLADGSQLSITVIPREAGLLVSFVLPAGVTPARSSLPGAVRLGRWTATFVAVPAEGIAWEASLRAPPAALQDVKVAVTSPRFPGGAGWQGLPAWLPQDTVVWSSNATWVLPLGQFGAIAPVEPLR
jgi:hypothetical protein